MHLRHPADARTLAWAFGLLPALVVVTIAFPQTAGWLAPLSAYAAYSAAVIAHNHNHCPTFASRRVNELFSAWISVFYGFPTYGWIPTHNENHHRHRGAEGDATVRAWVGQRDSMWRAATHFFRSTRTQAPLLQAYRERARRRAGGRRAIVLQTAAVVVSHVAVLGLAIALHGALRGSLVYVSALGGPAFFALWAIMLTNWVQHVGCDPADAYGHSRNFVAAWFNALVFDNGFHTVHHERPGLHWSEARAAHDAIAPRIPAELLVSSPLRYAWDTYGLSRRGRGSSGFA